MGQCKETEIGSFWEKLQLRQQLLMVRPFSKEN